MANQRIINLEGLLLKWLSDNLKLIPEWKDLLDVLHSDYNIEISLVYDVGLNWKCSNPFLIDSWLVIHIPLPFFCQFVDDQAM